MIQSLLLSYPVVQQPNPVYVDRTHLTEFRSATERGCIGILAESFAPFLACKIGDAVTVTDEIGEHTYRVTELCDAEALDGGNPYSSFRAGDETLTSTELFERIYTPGRLVLQTCRCGNTARRFVICEVMHAIAPDSGAAKRGRPCRSALSVYLASKWLGDKHCTVDLCV